MDTAINISSQAWQTYLNNFSEFTGITNIIIHEDTFGEGFSWQV